MLSEIVFHIALCKHEQADRAQTFVNNTKRQGSLPTAMDLKLALDAWKAASDWWGIYLAEYPSSQSASSARLNKANALQHLGQKDPAINLLEIVSNDLIPLEKTARLYAVKQLKSK